jgi:hypothetical protein
MSIANILLGSGGPFLFFRTITTDQTDYNLYNQMVAAGWNGQTPVLVDLTINAGVVIGASSNTGYAFQVSSIPSNSNISITNNGYIVGKGGTGVGKGYPNQTDYNLTAPSYANGGTALYTNYPISINNASGVVGGGGGGGGAGGATSADCSCSSCGGVELNGMAPGGGGAGYGSAGHGYTNWKNNTGYRLGLVSGNAGSATSAGSGYGTGGTGGGLGQAGSTGGGSSRCGYTDQSGPGTGGAAGACTSGNSNITWTSTGTRYGALN